MYEPPIQPDDTQANQSQSRPTLPRRPSHSRPLPSWALLGLLIFTGISLVASFMLLFTPKASTPEQEALQITIILGSERRDVESNVATVSDLLREQGISLAADDALSPAAETALSDGMVITIAHARTVSLEREGVRESIQTPFDNPAAILDAAGIVIDAQDKLWIDGTLATIEEARLWPVPVNEIVVQEAYTVTILDGINQRVIQTTAATVGDALYEAGIDIFLTDLISPDTSQAISSDMSISINRAKPVTIRVDGTTLESRVQGATVADALSEAGIALLGLDYSIPAESATIEANMTITILRVTESILSTEERIPYETVYQADANLALDERQVLQSGVEGIQRYNERVRYEDGAEIWREPAGTEMIQAPQNAIVAYGTQIVLRTIDTPEGPKEYWRQLRVYATSYHPAALGGDNVTAIGETLRRGIVGANPRLIPYRTNIYVPNYGVGMIADTGGPRSSPYWIDLGYSDEDYRAWHNYVDIYLLTPVPAEINYLLPEWTPMAGLPDN